MVLFFNSNYKSKGLYMYSIKYIENHMPINTKNKVLMY